MARKARLWRRCSSATPSCRRTLTLTLTLLPPLPLPLFLPLTHALPLTPTLTNSQSDLQRLDAALLREEKGHGPLELRQVNLDAEIVASKLRATALEAQHYLLWRFSP